MTAGAPGGKAYGDPTARTDKKSGTLTFYIYGTDTFKFAENKITNQNQGALCKIDSNGPARCGIPAAVWDDNGANLIPGCGENTGTGTTGNKCLPGLPTTVSDYFYQYGPLYGEKKCTNNETYDNGKCGTSPADDLVGYFGNKTFAVSFGGTLVLSGYKGVNPATNDATLTDSGFSWIRLAADLKPRDTTLTLDKTPGDRWQKGDEIVVTTTDYLPGHSEVLVVDSVTGNQVTFHNRDPNIKGAQWLHRGTRYTINLGDAKDRLVNAGMDSTLVNNGAETRAAVALLTRSIRIVTAGDSMKQKLENANQNYQYGAQFVVRQGAQKVNIQGVEFNNMGVGGRLGHYPVHFHMARLLPPDTYVKDSSVNVSMTRWFVLHSTQNVTLQRNVGWQSIGHGYYLEDGTEADNKLYSNIGILARAAINNSQNPRKIPGIFADNQTPYIKPNDPNRGFPYRSDAEYPTVFWITNGWNDFVGNMAAGAGACGAAYWLVPFTNTDMPDWPTPNNTTVGNHMKWSYDTAGHFGYAGLQSVRNNATDTTFGGTTPLKTFYMNYATTAMMSFQTTPDAPDCNGFIASGVTSAQIYPTISEVASISPRPIRVAKATPEKPDEPGTKPDLINDGYYPHAIGAREGTICPPLLPSDPNSPPNCGIFSNKVYSAPAAAAKCAAGNQSNCAVTVIDHFTSSFTWAEGNIAAVWLRPQWYLLDNSVISDVQNGGANFVTGGDFTHASSIPGLWQVAKSTIFIGHTQPQDKDHGFALDYGPFNDSSTVKCDALKTGQGVPAYCLNTDEGISMPALGLFTNQRLFSIYDGPNYEDSNAFLDITTTKCPIAGYRADCMYGQGVGVGILKNPDTNSAQPCYLPNAAIAWKQPNGFFYPPAFHSTNLYFGNVDLLHYVIDPLVLPVGAAADVSISIGSPAVISWTGHGFVPGQEVYFTSTGGPPPTGINVGDTYYVIAAGLTDNSFQIAATKGGAAINTTRPACELDEKPCKPARTGYAKWKYDFGQGGSYITDVWAARKDYCNAQVGMFDNFTSIDRQTELNDDDGSLTGLSNNENNPAVKQTISINEDKFFGAPIDVPECASSIGANSKAANACSPLSNTAPPPTARTSPYDYVATVIYHPQYPTSQKPCPDGTQTTCSWTSVCTNETCYGVPLYRQFLTGTNTGSEQTSTREWKQWYKNGCGTANPPKLNSPQCRWPFIRMAGMDRAVRETLTINNGTYYLDTTVPYGMQKSERFNKPGNFLFNTFDPGETYYVFFVYAKKTTKQTYQMYLGTQPEKSEIKPVQVQIPGDIMPKEYTGSNFLSVDRAANGIVSVTVDFSSDGVASLLAPTKANGLCQPASFCTADGTTGCTSALTDKSPLVKVNSAMLQESQRVCSKWAVKDLDCPKDGCLGFSFTIPSTGFVADATIDKPTPHRPFPTSFPNWKVTFAPGSNPGQCYYPKIPGSSNCPVP